MSDNTGLNVLLQKTPATDEQLFAMIGIRLEALKPLLEEHVVTPLSAHLCFGHGGPGIRFGDQKGEFLGNYLHYHGDMRCVIFPTSDSTEVGEFRNVYHWGLDPLGRWLLIKAQCGTVDGKTVINNVWVEGFKTAEEVCQKIILKPRTILNHLFETIRNWTDAKKAEVQELKRLQDQWLEQNYALKALDALKS